MTQQYLKERFTYNEGFLYWKTNVDNKLIGKKAGTVHKYKGGNRRNICLSKKNYRASRLIFLFHKGWLPKVVDHENRITTDDRIENLRPSTQQQNSKNKTSAKNSSSQYLGVSFHKARNNWVSKIMDSGNGIYLGSFDNEADAALAYNKAAVKHHGEFANLNVIKYLSGSPLAKQEY